MRYSRQAIIITALTLLGFSVAHLFARTPDNRYSSTIYWVFFSSKNGTQTCIVSPRASERRNLRAFAPDFSQFDALVDESFISLVEALGGRVRNVSRWLNAISIEADSATLEAVKHLPFVTAVRPVASYSMPQPTERPFAALSLPKPAVFDYGPSSTQVSMVSIDSLHNAGLSGAGILVGVMDTGFDTSHVAFSRLNSEGRLIATRDFINGDSDVMDSPDIQRFHGTAVLSVLAGFDEGHLIGPAFGAEYALAKTEIEQREIRAEEDYWVAAAEWMESLGVDIISSSVGYIDWYDTTDLDGQTAVITRAANMAESLGIVVVNAAGNEGNNPSWRKVIPPADGYRVVAVGGVDANSEIIDFSSRGPTADGRIKPDFCALGAGDYGALYTGGYASFSGTSFAAPLVAGGIALLLEGHPEWTPADVISVLRQASSRAYMPNNDYGWGIPNFVDAYFGLPYRPSGLPGVIITPQPAIDSAAFHLSVPQAADVFFSIHDVSGTPLIEREFQVAEATVITFLWNGENDSGKRVASGIYICVLKASGTSVREKFFFVRR